MQVIRQLYLEEFSTLQMDATVKNFIRIIATKRVRERLLTRVESEGSS